VVRDETAAQLRDDPFGAAPEAALVAAAAVTVLFASLGFAVSAAGAMRVRDGEFAVLRALGTTRRRLARLVAVEHGVLVALALLVGTALGMVLTYALVPLVVLTGQATRPLPPVLVEVPLLRLAALLAALAAGPALVTVALALRRAKPVMTLRDEVTQ
jgi:ABC-type antimicrobial peptide transport system permease subunit